MKSLNWLLWLVIMALFIGGMASLSENISITFSNWDIEVPFGMVFFVLFILIIFFVMIDRLIQNLNFFERWQRQRKMRKARALMLQGFGHLATHDIQAAQSVARHIEELWQSSEQDPFKLVFEGRLAEQEGDIDAAKQKYDMLESSKDTRLYALRAKLRLAYVRQDDALIQKISARALKLAPEDLSLYMVQIEALIANKKWQKAHRLLHKIEMQSLLSADIAMQKKMEIYLDEASDKMLHNNYSSARHLAQKAAKIKPSPQAARLEIEALMAGGHRKAAVKSLQQAWRQNPDILLLPLWERLAPADQRFSFYESMLKLNAGSPLTHAALVKIAIGENRAMEARAHLDVLERHHSDSLEYAQSKEMVVRLLDHDRPAAEQWKNRADTLRMARFSQTPQTIMSPAKLSFLPDPLEQ